MAKQGTVTPTGFPLKYYTIRTVTSPEDAELGRRRYCGVAPAASFFDLDTAENVRDYLGRDEEGAKRKSTKVNLAILSTLEGERESFSLLNSGITVVARGAKVVDDKRTAILDDPSIINGAQTHGVLKDYFAQHPEDAVLPSVNFELIVTEDDDLIAAISIARNYQNEVRSLSIYGRKGRFDELEKALRRRDKTVRLRTSETDFGPEYLDTEKLIQVLTAMAPTSIPLPSTEKRKVKTPETIYRVYAYRHRSRCLTDFADVMDKPDEWPEAHRYFLDVAYDTWQLYTRLRGEQAFSRLQCVQASNPGGNPKMVAPDGVPDGIVFPMLSALSRFMNKKGDRWQFRIPTRFPWPTFYQFTMLQETSTAKNNPQTMGKDRDVYIALHGSIDMFFATDALNLA